MHEDSSKMSEYRENLNILTHFLQKSKLFQIRNSKSEMFCKNVIEILEKCENIAKNVRISRKLEYCDTIFAKILNCFIFEIQKVKRFVDSSNM